MAHDTASLVAEYQASGLTQKDFCRGKGIAVSALQYHLGKTRKHNEGTSEKTVSASTGRFIPVQLQETDKAITTVVVVRGPFADGELIELVRAALSDA